MIVSILMAASVALAPQPALAHADVDHAGVRYQLTYRPHITAKMKTIGMSAGTRMSTERCRISADIAVERHIRRDAAGPSLERLLPARRTIALHRPGSCAMIRDDLAAVIGERQEEVRAHVAAVAAADRGEALAEIATAQQLAMD